MPLFDYCLSFIIKCDLFIKNVKSHLSDEISIDCNYISQSIYQFDQTNIKFNRQLKKSFILISFQSNSVNKKVIQCIESVQQSPHQINYLINTFPIEPIKMTSTSLDFQKLYEDNNIIKELQKNQKIMLSVKLNKINNVNKSQQRILLLTDRYLYNLKPASFMNLFSRIKRKIPYSNIQAMTVSRFGSQFVVHVGIQHDYRFSSPNLKLKIVEMIVDMWCKCHQKKMPLYYNDQLSLEQYTTTCDDVQKKVKKKHPSEPLYLDSESLKQSDQTKAESKLVFKNQNSEGDVGSFEEFQLLKVLGRGAFGKVMLCKNNHNNKYYAVKSMRKQNLIEKQHLQKTRTQRILLEKAKHPFLVSLQYAFQTKQKIFFVMNFIRGGQMFTQLRKCKKFNQNRAKFYAAQVYLAIRYMHDIGYVYRDLKPQNILFEPDGYIKISDYGLAKNLKPNEKTYSLAGTPDYVSPQVILNKGQSFPTDWWAYGILVYEMIYGSPPFYNRDHEKMFHDILNRQLFFDNSKVQASQQARSLIYNLLKKDPEQRLGTKNQDDIKNHPWFKDINWQKILKKQIKPQFIPVISNQIDVSNFDQDFTNQKPVNSLVASDVLLLSRFQKQFQGLQFNKEHQDAKTPGSTQKSQPSFAKKKK